MTRLRPLGAFFGAMLINFGLLQLISTLNNLPQREARAETTAAKREVIRWNPITPPPPVEPLEIAAATASNLPSTQPSSTPSLEGATALPGISQLPISSAVSGQSTGPQKAADPEPPAKGIYSAAELQEPAVPLRKVQPIYPNAARRRGLTGEVKIRFIVNEHGRVEQARAIGGAALLNDAALQAITAWTFTPPKHHHQLVKQWYEHRFQFTLD